MTMVFKPFNFVCFCLLLLASKVMSIKLKNLPHCAWQATLAVYQYLVHTSLTVFKLTIALLESAEEGK